MTDEFDILKMHLDQAEQELAEYKKFFKAVCKLTVNHDVINDCASVSPENLDIALRSIEPEWFNHPENWRD